MSYYPNTTSTSTKTKGKYVKSMSRVACETRAERAETRNLWTQDEELLLTECYIQVSEDSNIGSEQKNDTFCYKVLVQYNEQAKISKFPSRNKNMSMEKWNPMNREVGRFNSLVNETKTLNGENNEDLMTRIEILYKSVTGIDFKHKRAWAFLKVKHKWKNPDSTNARRNRGCVTDSKPELFGDDELPLPPNKQRIAKSQRSSNSTASSGSNPTMFQEILQQQYELDRKKKIERLNRETTSRVELFNYKKVAEDLKVLQMDTRGMVPFDAAIINTQKAQIRALYQPKN
ncbi:hypothetical protein Tco_1091293 [Tanacetum coccineum]|uniref:No apical meristem-associated C-terminal domain-containing protein n=1 Tax=Tanacetum coccineum TaxID=301880 RepID=A0ABQ5I7Z0_9ASTR